MHYTTTHVPEVLIAIRILLPKSNPQSRPKLDPSFDVSTLVAPVNPLRRESGVPGQMLSFMDDEDVVGPPRELIPELLLLLLWLLLLLLWLLLLPA